MDFVKSIISELPKQVTARDSEDFGSARNDASSISRDQYASYTQNIDPVIDKLLLDTKDTSIIDAAPEQAETASNIAKGITQRNLERYGSELTPAQQREMKRSQQRGTKISEANAINFARRDQAQVNLQRLVTAGNVGVSMQGRGNNMLGIAAGNEANRQNAYKQDQASARAQRASTLGTVAMLAFAL